MYDMEALRRLRENIDFGSEKERQKFAKQLESLVQSWTVHLSILNLAFEDVDTDCLHTQAYRKSQLPDFNLILKKDEIDRLLTDSLHGRNRFISLAIKAGYRDEPELDSDGKPVTRRTTALHRAARLSTRQVSSSIVRDLFRVYDKFDANYADEDGLTHLHVACLFGYEDVVRKFLALGADPNCRAKETGYTTLHLAAQLGNDAMVGLLLGHGANPNVADAQGRTALHAICEQLGDDWFLAQMLLELCDEKFRPVHVNAWDKEGNTALSLAMESENEMLVRLLLKNGADRTLTDEAENVMSRELAKLERLAGISVE